MQYKFMSKVNPRLFKNVGTISPSLLRSLLPNIDFFSNSNIDLITQNDEIVTYETDIFVNPEEQNGASCLLLTENVGPDGLITPGVLFCEKKSHKPRCNPNCVPVKYSEMQFIGGMMREGEDPLDCLHRELVEEVSFGEGANVEFIAQLPSIHVNCSNINIFPFVGIVEGFNPEQLEIVDEKEIMHIHSVDFPLLAHSFHRKGMTSTHICREIGPLFSPEGYPIVWGVTARILAYFFKHVEERVSKKVIIV